MNSKHWTRVNRALLNSLEVKVTGLMEGLTYIFRVCAENLAGPGPFSDPTDRTVAMDAIRKILVLSDMKQQRCSERGNKQPKQTDLFMDAQSALNALLAPPDGRLL